MEITPEKLMVASPAYWAIKGKIELPSGPFSFTGREYLLQPLNDNVPLKVIIKGTQGGFTTTEILESLHGQRYGKYPQGVLYLFPTGDDVGEFSKSRFNPIIEANKELIGQFVKDTDTFSLKKIGKSYLFLRGARLTQKIENEDKESSKLRSISVDRVVYDEWDLMDEDVRVKAQERMGASTVKQESFLSNPTIPDYGIDKIWQQTDQRHWMIKCEKCGEFTCLELEFPECIIIGPDGKGIRLCKKCREPINRQKGEWVAKWPNKSKEAAGYWWSQLNSPTIDPAEVLKAYQNPPGGNIADVVRLKLGKAYIEAENRLTKQDIYAVCSNYGIYPNDEGPCCFGADVGNFIHLVVAKKTESGIPRIVYLGRHSSINDIYGLFERYNVQLGCIDLYPETRMVRELQKVAKFPVFGLDYHEKEIKGVVEDQAAMVLKVARTESMDNVHSVYSKGKIVLPCRSSEVDEYAIEMSNTAKKLVEDVKGNRIYRYIKLGPDHYYHATNAMLLVIDRLPNLGGNITLEDIKELQRATGYA